MRVTADYKDLWLLADSIMLIEPKRISSGCKPELALGRSLLSVCICENLRPIIITLLRYSRKSLK